MEFIIVEGEVFKPLLGSKTMQPMKLIALQYHNILHAAQTNEHCHVAAGTMETPLQESENVFQGRTFARKT